MAADKEHVLSQKRASASWGVEVPVGYSEVINSKAFAGNFEGFLVAGPWTAAPVPMHSP
jgi:hypothetical protein